MTDPSGRLTHVFPAVSVLAEADLSHLGMPASRRRSLVALVGGLASRDIVLDAGADWNRAREQLLSLPRHRAVDRGGDRDAGPG